MNKNVLNPQDAPSAKLAECFITRGTQRLNIFSAKSFEANVGIETEEVNSVGRTMKGHKATGMEGTFSMTIYKCTRFFVDIVTEYKNTGILPTFEIQVTSEDPATSIGKDTKIYTGCQIDGDVLLSMFDAEGDFIEQEVEGFFDDWESAADYTNPAGM